jgi:hypothetical protein
MTRTMPFQVELLRLQHSEQHVAVAQHHHTPRRRTVGYTATRHAVVAPKRNMHPGTLPRTNAGVMFRRRPVSELAKPDGSKPLVTREVLDRIAGAGQQTVLDHISPAGVASATGGEQHTALVRPHLRQGRDEWLGIHSVVPEVPQHISRRVNRALLKLSTQLRRWKQDLRGELITEPLLVAVGEHNLASINTSEQKMGDFVRGRESLSANIVAIPDKDEGVAWPV